LPPAVQVAVDPDVAVGPVDRVERGPEGALDLVLGRAPRDDRRDLALIDRRPDLQVGAADEAEDGRERSLSRSAHGGPPHLNALKSSRPRSSPAALAQLWLSYAWLGSTAVRG